MKREIKFRGKRLDNGDWMYGNLVFDYDNKPMILTTGYSHTGSAFSGCVNVIPETVGQFTGLKERDGKEIYEGDIITVRGRFRTRSQTSLRKSKALEVEIDREIERVRAMGFSAPQQPGQPNLFSPTT